MDRRLLDLARDQLQQVLDEGTGFELVAKGVDGPMGTDHRADAIWTLRASSDEWRLLVEVKSTLWPRDVQALADKAGALTAEVKADRCVVVAPRLTDRTREFLERQGIDYIDLRGDIRVTIPGRMLVMAHGVGEPPASNLPNQKDRVANPFAGKASRIVRALLAEPRRWWGVTELAERVDVSAGLSVKTLRTLETDLYVRRDRRRRARLVDGESLLRRWAAVARNPFRGAGRFASPIPNPDELAIRLGERLSCLGVGYALSRLSAAKFIEPFAPARVVDVYLDRDPIDLAPKLDLFPVERGESVRLVQPADRGVLQFTERRQGVTLVSAAQLFVDLSNARGREGDVAERLLEKRLVGMWKEEYRRVPGWGLAD
ncbi:MAG: hypothetical protein OXU74_16515 [Gemmatimonadota bacterium]|nr:hypothetical protein [Gemmatimonadota bacterium]